MISRHAYFITSVNHHHTNEQILALLEQLVAQNHELSRQVAALQAKVAVLEHKIDQIAEEAGLI
jgi:cell division protein FtsB